MFGSNHIRKTTIALLLLLMLASLAPPIATASPTGDCSGLLGALNCLLDNGPI